MADSSGIHRCRTDGPAVAPLPDVGLVEELSKIETPFMTRAMRRTNRKDSTGSRANAELAHESALSRYRWCARIFPLESTRKRSAVSSLAAVASANDRFADWLGDGGAAGAVNSARHTRQCRCPRWRATGDGGAHSPEGMMMGGSRRRAMRFARRNRPTDPERPQGRGCSRRNAR